MYAYFAQRAFSPVLASPYKDINEDVVVEVISDSLQKYRGSLRVQIFKLNSLSPVFNEEFNVTAVSTTSHIRYVISFSRIQSIKINYRIT